MALSDIYEDGDQIFLIGFSRGAVAVRALSGMIITCGLLRSKYLKSVEQAWDYYTKPSTAEQESHDFHKRIGKETFSNIHISAIGVWDTVLGAKIEREAVWERQGFQFKIGYELKLSDVRFQTPDLHAKIGNAFHALAINECRREFKYVPWTKVIGLKSWTTSIPNVKQVWFPGAHSNVGGGYEDQRLSDISSDWMIRNLQEFGLHFHEEIIQETVKPSILGHLYDFLDRLDRIHRGSKYFFGSETLTWARRFIALPLRFAGTQSPTRA